MKQNESTITLTVKIPIEMRERARIIQGETGATLAAIMRIAFNKYLNEKLNQTEVAQ